MVSFLMDERHFSLLCIVVEDNGDYIKALVPFLSEVLPLDFWGSPLCSNQVTVVAFQPVQLTQASFLQKNQTLQNHFLIFVTLRWHRVSVACKNQSF